MTQPQYPQQQYPPQQPMMPPVAPAGPPQSIASFFSGGGGKSLSWKDMPIGTSFQGVIKAIHPPQQATDPATQLPAFTRQNKPKMQVRVDLATSYRDPADPEDDGSRSLYVGGWMTGAIGDAVRKAGAQEPQVGGTLVVQLVDKEAPDRPGLNPTNKYAASYQPPPVTGGFFGGGDQGGQQQAPQQQYAPPPVQQQAPQQYQQPVPQPSMAPGGGYVQQPPQQQSPAQQAPPVQQAPQQVPAALGAIVERPPQISEAAWATMDDATKASLAATLANTPPF